MSTELPQKRGEEEETKSSSPSEAEEEIYLFDLNFMPKNKMSKKCPSCLSLLGDGTRNKIIQCLKKKPTTVSNIAANFSLKQPTISHHLKILKELGMVKSKKTGREVCYCLNNKYPCKKCNIFKMPFKV